MVLAFKKQFVEPILLGTKVHTIREDKRRRWKAGKVIHFATGVRSKFYTEFKVDTCVSCQTIFMTYAHNDIIEITIGDKYLYRPDIEKLAKNDGFKSYEEFFEWFYPVIKASEGQCFSGRIIHWTDLKY